MMKEVFSATKSCETGCPKCLSHYLKGREQCGDCHQPLDPTLFRGKKRKLKDCSPSLLSGLFDPVDDGFDTGGAEESKAPFRWNDPMTINIVGFVICVAILLSMVSG